MKNKILEEVAPDFAFISKISNAQNPLPGFPLNKISQFQEDKQWPQKIRRRKRDLGKMSMQDNPLRIEKTPSIVNKVEDDPFRFQ